jgi:thioredoxin-dependent peroxiredoxin
MGAGIDAGGDDPMTREREGVLLQPGDEAPDFVALDGEGKTWRLSDLRGRRVVLYFYPADDTPGCTAEACDFRDARSAFEEEGYVVLGASPQGAESHQAFSKKHHLTFPLLVDSDLDIAARYGALRSERDYWRDVPLDVKRSTFVIDERGAITHALYGVQGQGHVEALKDLLGL